MRKFLILCLTFLFLVAFGNYVMANSPGAKTKSAAAPIKPGTKAERYAVLNPRADLPPIDAHPLAPRLTSVEGKTVYVYGLDFSMEPGLEIMIMIARGLAKAVPGIKVVYLSDRYGDTTADPIVPSIRIARHQIDAHYQRTFKEAEQKADAVVTGLGF